MNTNRAFSYQQKTASHRLARWAAAPIAAMLALTASALADPRYTLTELATPAGCDFAVAWQINDQGYVAGYSNRLSGAKLPLLAGRSNDLFGLTTGPAALSADFYIRETKA
jgi:hypothetical protein